MLFLICKAMNMWRTLCMSIKANDSHGSVISVVILILKWTRAFLELSYSARNVSNL